MSHGMRIACNNGEVHMKSSKHHSQSHKRKAPVKVEPLETTPLEGLSMEGEAIEFSDPHFQSELEYDGYENIEDYDNHFRNLNVESNEDPEKELNFEKDSADTHPNRS